MQFTLNNSKHLTPLMFPKPSILPKPSFVFFSFSVYFCQQSKASSLSLPHFSVTIFIGSQTNRVEGQVQNISSLSLTHLSLSLSLSLLPLTFSLLDLVDSESMTTFFFSRQIARSDLSCERSWLGRPPWAV